MSQPELVLGNLNFTGELPGVEFQLKALGSRHGTSWGNADVVTAVVESLLNDGDLVQFVRSTNREGTIGISILANDSAALARAEELLMSELYRPNTLTWIHPDGLGPATVFDVVTSSLEEQFDDDNENRLVRRYAVKLVLFPSSRSAVDAVVAATGSGVDPVGSPTEVVVTNADTTAGFVWVAPNTTLSDGGAYVQSTLQSDGDASMGYDIGADTNYSATPLLVVDAQQSFADPESALQAWLPTTSLFQTERPLTLISSIPSPLGSPWRRYIYDAGAYASAIRRIRVQGGCGKNHSHTSERLKVTRIAFSNGQAAYAGTTRQLFRSMFVRGSVRTQASLHLEHTTSNLGGVLLWSGPAGNATPLRALRFNGNPTVTADATTVSGAYEDIEPTDFQADVPAAALLEGAYAPMARFKLPSGGSASRTVTVTAQTYIGGAPVGDPVTASKVITVGDSSWANYMLDTIPLPPTVTPSPDATIRVSIGSQSPLLMDEAWLFNITDGELTWVTVNKRHLWVDAATLESPRPRLWAGDAADRSDAYDITALAESWGDHKFEPGEWAAFTVTTLAQNAALSATYPIRFHTYAAE